MKDEEDKVWKRPKKKKWNPFNNTIFTVGFSFFAAIVLWFFLSTQDSTATTRELTDVPIQLINSEAAINGSLHIYSQNELYADVTILASSNTVRNRLTADDITVTGTFKPNSLKTTGTGLMTATVTLQATKNSTLVDYEIKEITPSEITVEYDRADENSLTIEKDLSMSSAQTGYIIGTPSLSEETVKITGPESSVKQVSRAVVKVEQTEIKEDTTVSASLTLYDQDDKEISLETLPYLELSVTEVDVTIPVLAKKTVEIKPLVIGQPNGFSDSRITVEPSTIDIAAASDEIDSINYIDLNAENAIYFGDVTFDNYKFTMEIPVPNNVQNLNKVTEATVSFNLNGFKEVTLSTDNIELLNKPSDNVAVVTQSLSVTIIGSESQVAKLTSDSIYVTVDLTKQTPDSGEKTLPAEVHFMGAGADTCWAVTVDGNDYEVTVNLSANEEEVSSEAE